MTATITVVPEEAEFFGCLLLANSHKILIETPKESYVTPDAVTFHDYLLDHYRKFNTLPTVERVKKEKGIEFPKGSKLNRTADEALNDLNEAKHMLAYKRMFAKLGEARETAVEKGLNQNELGREYHKIVAEAYSALEARRSSSDLVIASDSHREAVTTLMERRRANQGITGYRLPWPTVTNHTYGLEPGDLMVILARPGRGKTMLLTKLGDTLLDQLQDDGSILYVSNELTDEQMVDRLLMMRTGIPLSNIRKGLVEKRDLDKFFGSYSRVQSRILASEGMGGITVSQIVASTKLHKASVVLIDGAYMLTPTSGRSDAYHIGIGSIITGLKAAAKQLGVPIVVTWQLNRTAAMDVAAAAGSDKVGQDSDVAIAIGGSPDDDDTSTLELISLKNRKGPPFSLWINNTHGPGFLSQVSSDVEETELSQLGPHSLDLVEL